MRRLRGLFIALAVLAISAGAALAGLPQAAADGLARAAEASGKTVPVGPDVQPPAEEQEQVVDEEQDEETEAPDPETEEAADTDNHGATVSEAAQGETPAGWLNHGAYVSAVARGLAQPGDEAPAEAVANGGRMPKPENAAAAKAAKPDKPEKPDKPDVPSR